jgi:hypothetical protein
MALTYRLTTLEKLKKYLGINTENTQPDDKLGPLIDAATLAIEAYCDNAFVQRAFTHYDRAGINGHKGGAKFIFPPRHPIVSVASITEAPSGTIPATDYVVYDSYLEHISCWPTPENRWTVAYTAGRYASTDAVEENLRLACHMLVEDWHMKPTGPVQSSSSAQRSVGFTEAEIPARVKLLLDSGGYVSRAV